MKENDRINVVRRMLLATTSPPGTVNELKRSHSVRKRKRSSDESENRTVIEYAYQGKRLCAKAFNAMTYITSIRSPHAQFYESKRSQTRKGNPSHQSIIVAAFLQPYSGKNGLPDPRGTVAISDKVRRYLPSSTTKNEVYQECKAKWYSIAEAALNHEFIPKIPPNALSTQQFSLAWQAHYCELKIASPISDFCDYCVRQTNLIKQLAGSEKEEAEELENHREKAGEDYAYYNRTRLRQAEQPDNGTLLLIFDFAEKFLLPSMERQPGNLNFVTSLKFDEFGISNSKTGKTIVYGLPEGHWPSSKGPDIVISMLYHAIQYYQTSAQNGKPSRLILHADNCSGQNKNRYLLWFCS